MKRIMAMAAASMLLLATLAGCGNSEDATTQNGNPAGSATAAAATSTNATAKTETVAATDDGDLGDFHVKILDSSVVEDWEGNRAIRITYEFTNNGSEAVAASIALTLQAYQDGIELDPTFIGMENEDEERDNADKNVKTGVTITCAACFVLSNESEVEFEATEFVSLSNAKVVKTFTIT